MTNSPNQWVEKIAAVIREKVSSPAFTDLALNEAHSHDQVSAAEAIAALFDERTKEMREALEPFAREAELWSEDDGDLGREADAMRLTAGGPSELTLGNYRRARQALKDTDHGR